MITLLNGKFYDLAVCAEDKSVRTQQNLEVVLFDYYKYSSYTRK